MKDKFFNVLTVCIITLVVIAPALLTIALVYYHHSTYYSQPGLTQVTPSHSGNDNLGIGLIVFLPLGFCLGVSFNDGWRIYREMMHKARVEQLERTWQRGI